MKLQEQKEALERHLEMKEKAHSAKFSHGVPNEGAYISSCTVINDIYKQLTEVCDELGIDIPIRW